MDDINKTADQIAAEASKAKAELGEILQGIGRSIEEGLRSLGTRGNVLNVRVDDPSIEAIDSLISAGVFKTRSEAAAYLIQVGIESKSEVFGKVGETAKRITELREEMKDALRRGVGKAENAVPPIREAAVSDIPPAGTGPDYTEVTGVNS
jgi:Arc/MetJ-type ribon-helix-helix transcriptional regulator